MPYSRINKMLEVSEIKDELLKLGSEHPLRVTLDKIGGERIFRYHQFLLVDTRFSLHTLFIDKNAQSLRDEFATQLGENHIENWHFLSDLSNANLITNPKQRGDELNRVFDYHIIGLNLSYGHRKALLEKRKIKLVIEDFNEVITEVVNLIRSNLTRAQTSGDFNSQKMVVAVQTYNKSDGSFIQADNYENKKKRHTKTMSMVDLQGKDTLTPIQNATKKLITPAPSVQPEKIILSRHGRNNTWVLGMEAHGLVKEKSKALSVSSAPPAEEDRTLAAIKY